MTEQSILYQSLLENVACNLCGTNDYRLIYPGRYERAKPQELVSTFRSSGDEILVDPLVECQRCGLKYLNPRLREDIILEAYAAGTDELFVSQVKAREKTFEKSLRLIEKFVATKGKILDVGTGGGSFLHVAKTQGWEVQGCEPNRWLVEWAYKHYGLPIYPGTIFDQSWSDQYFDVVTLWDVLEHTTDPKKVLKECRRILRKEGLLLVNYPDIDSLIARLMGRRWVFLLSIHLYYFTFVTLSRMLKDCGFEVIFHKRHWQSLELDYIFQRMQSYLPLMAETGRKVINGLGLQHVVVPYWMGQSLVFAKASF